MHTDARVRIGRNAGAHERIHKMIVDDLQEIIDGCRKGLEIPNQPKVVTDGFQRWLDIVEEAQRELMRLQELVADEVNE